MSKTAEEWKKLYTIALSDLSYCVGMLEGLGHPSVYINEQVGQMLETLEAERAGSPPPLPSEHSATRKLTTEEDGSDEQQA